MSPIKRPVRGFGDRFDGVRTRVASGTGFEDLFHLEERLELVEEAVGENALLAERLTHQVSDLERLLIGPLEKRTQM